jgi:hypothetical protein
METALKRRIAPSVPLTLELDDDNGSKMVRNFRLSFDANAAAEVEERTGFNMLRGEIWEKLSFKGLSVMFWASVLANHPEYDTEDQHGNRTDDGLRVIRSYMGIGNTAQISEVVEKAFLASLPKHKREAIEAERIRREKEKAPFVAAAAGGTETPPAAAQPGSNSGPSPDTTSASPSESSAASLGPRSTP